MNATYKHASPEGDTYTEKNPWFAQTGEVLYYATAESNQVTPENADDQWKWLTKEEVENNTDIEPQIKLYALGALEVLGT